MATRRPEIIHGCTGAMGRILLPGLLAVLLHLPGRPCLAQETGALSVTSEPSGLSVYVDQTLIGITPIERYALPAGRHEIRIPNPDQTDWEMRDRMQEIEIVAGETSTVHVRFVGIITVTSTPFDAEVYVDGVRMGTTPIRLRDLPPGVHTIVIRKDAYKEEQRTVIVRDITSRTLHVSLAPEKKVQPALLSKRRHPVRKTIKYATLGLGALFVGLALNENRLADNANARYLRTGDPAALERFFKAAGRHDDRRKTFAILAQVNFLAAAYFFISPLFRSGARQTGAGR